MNNPEQTCVWLPRSGSARNSRGFSLVEILVVMGILTLLMAISIPTLLGSKRGNSFQANLVQLSTVLEHARQLSISSNSYVWVGFTAMVESNGQAGIEAVTVVSNDGTDVLAWNGESFNLNTDSRFAVDGKCYRFSGLSLQPAGTYSSDQIPGLSGVPPASDQNALAEGSGAFTWSSPQSRMFTQILRFSPRGGVSNGNSFVPFIEMDLAPSLPNGQTDPVNVAVLRINGLTGITSLYRR